MTPMRNPSEMTQEELEQLASKLLQELRSVWARIPGLVVPHATRQRLSGFAVNVPVQAIEADFAACDSDKTLAKAIAAPDVLYDHRYTGIFAELRDELKTLATGLDYTLRLKRFKLGDAMLKVYDYGRTLAQDPANGALR